MLRIFSVSTPIFSFLLAIFICFLADKYKENIKIKIILAALSLMVIYGGLTFQIFSMITPYSNFGKIHSPFVAKLPEVGDLDAKVYDWIFKNTDNYARFFPYDPVLMIRTGRMSPGNLYALFPNYKIPIYDSIIDNCELDSINKFKIDYFILSPNGFSAADYLKKCTKLNAELVFRAKSGTDYRDVYIIKK
jgi:hypothetical protein